MNIEEFENWQYVFSKMRDEGFHYCFKHYSRFEEIKDEKFHELRLKYLESANNLESYILENLEDEIDYGDEYDEF